MGRGGRFFYGAGGAGGAGSWMGQVGQVRAPLAPAKGRDHTARSRRLAPGGPPGSPRQDGGPPVWASWRAPKSAPKASGGLRAPALLGLPGGLPAPARGHARKREGVAQARTRCPATRCRKGEPEGSQTAPVLACGGAAGAWRRRAGARGAQGRRDRRAAAERVAATLLRRAALGDPPAGRRSSRRPGILPPAGDPPAGRGSSRRPGILPPAGDPPAGSQSPGVRHREDCFRLGEWLRLLAMVAEWLSVIDSPSGCATLRDCRGGPAKRTGVAPAAPPQPAPRRMSRCSESSMIP
jgi:hypothetical protein